MQSFDSEHTSMAEIRTTSSVQVTEALAESCRSATGEEIEPNT